MKTCSVTASSVSTGIQIDGYGVTLDCNNRIVTGNRTGVGVAIDANNVTVKECRIYDFDVGVGVNTGKTGNQIRDNTIYVDLDAIVNLGGTTTIRNNTIRRFDTGIYSTGTSTSIYKNTVSHTSGSGTYCVELRASGQTVYRNELTTCSTGIYTNTSSVTVYENDLIASTRGVYSTVAVNLWRTSPYHGNYWGHPNCPSGPYFTAGVDSNRSDARDLYPYGVPIAGLSFFPNPPACGADDDGDLHVDAALGGDDCDDSPITGAGCYNSCSAHYRDADGDGYGNPSISRQQCEPGDGYVVDNTDCDDTRPHVRPGLAETCDGYDNDCTNGDAAVEDPNEIDNDGDHYIECTNFINHSGADAFWGGDDCDDSTVTGPGCYKIEHCDTYYCDGDSDGYGRIDKNRLQCVPGNGYIADHTDCDDKDKNVHPGAPEVVNDGFDSDCDAREVCYRDWDDDGYRPDSTSTILSDDMDCDDSHEARSTDPTGDCDDAKPGCWSTCDDVDNDGWCPNNGGDCDDTVATGTSCSVGCLTYFRDVDSDGRGDANVTRAQCTEGGGYVSDNTDCYDNAASCTMNCTDLDLDDIFDCADTCIDVDGDGFGTPGGAGNTCTGADCDVTNPQHWNDCAVCIDSDGDGYGDDCDLGDDCDDQMDRCTVDCIDADLDGVRACEGDCDDHNPQVGPAAPELMLYPAELLAERGGLILPEDALNYSLTTDPAGFCPCSVETTIDINGVRKCTFTGDDPQTCSLLLTNQGNRGFAYNHLYIKSHDCSGNAIEKTVLLRVSIRDNQTAIISLLSGYGLAEASQIADSFQAGISGIHSESGAYALSFATPQDIGTLEPALLSHPAVERVWFPKPAVPAAPYDYPNDTYQLGATGIRVIDGGFQWHLKNDSTKYLTGYTCNSDADCWTEFGYTCNVRCRKPGREASSIAWMDEVDTMYRLTSGQSEGPLICVDDEPFDFNHPDFKWRVWTNFTECCGDPWGCPIDPNWWGERYWCSLHRGESVLAGAPGGKPCSTDADCGGTGTCLTVPSFSRCVDGHNGRGGSAMGDPCDPAAISSTCEDDICSLGCVDDKPWRPLCLTMPALGVCTDGAPGLPGVDDDGDGAADSDDPEVATLENVVLMNGLDDDGDCPNVDTNGDGSICRSGDTGVDEADEARLAALDDDENGAIDDAHGTSFKWAHEIGYLWGSTFLGMPADVAGSHWTHGNLVASTLGADVHNEATGLGVHPKARLAWCGSASWFPYTGYQYHDSIGADVVNQSWFAGRDRPPEVDFGPYVPSSILYTISAGNAFIDLDFEYSRGNYFYPQHLNAHENVVVVGGTDNQDDFVIRADGRRSAGEQAVLYGQTGSVFGQSVDFAAPAVGIFAYLGSEPTRGYWHVDGGESDSFGTSLAAPIAAGVAGILMSTHPYRFRRNPSEVHRHLASTLAPVRFAYSHVEAPDGTLLPIQMRKNGRVDVHRALEALPVTDADVAPIYGSTNDTLFFLTRRMGAEGSGALRLAAADLVTGAVSTATVPCHPFSCGYWQSTEVADHAVVLNDMAVFRTKVNVDPDLLPPGLGHDLLYSAQYDSSTNEFGPPQVIALDSGYSYVGPRGSGDRFVVVREGTDNWLVDFYTYAGGAWNRETATGPSRIGIRTEYKVVDVAHSTEGAFLLVQGLWLPPGEPGPSEFHVVWVDETGVVDVFTHSPSGATVNSVVVRFNSTSNTSYVAFGVSCDPTTTPGNECTSFGLWKVYIDRIARSFTISEVIKGHGEYAGADRLDVAPVVSLGCEVADCVHFVEPNIAATPLVAERTYVTQYCTNRDTQWGPTTYLGYADFGPRDLYPNLSWRVGNRFTSSVFSHDDDEYSELRSPLRLYRRAGCAGDWLTLEQVVP